MKKLLLVAVVTALGALTGCDDATLPYLTTIQVSSASASVPAGRTVQFTAQGTFSNSQTRDITSLVTWSSSTPPVGTINSSGLAQGYSQGTSTITATYNSVAAGTVTGTGTLTVAAPALVSIAVTNAASLVAGPSARGATIANGTSRQFLAYGLYSDGGVRAIPNSITTTSPTWAVAPATFATITNTGRATGIAAGTSTITATDTASSTSGTAPLVVTNASLVGIEVYPVGQTNNAVLGQTIAANTRLPYAAQGVFSDNTRQEITADAGWTSTNPAAATVSNVTPKGVATGVAVGGTTLQATLGGVTGTAPLIVSAASLSSITLTPGTAAVATGSTLLLTSTGKFSDSSTQNINLATSWTVAPANGSIATVDATGLVTGVAAGSATITAKLGLITTNATITVEAVKSISVAPAVPIVNPSTLNVAQGTASQFIATATLTDGSTQDVSANANWVALNPPTVTGTGPIAVVSDSPGSGGWVTGNAPGTAIIAATFGGFASVSGVTVTSATLSTLAITPSAPVHLALGASQPYQAVGTFSDSTTQSLTNQVTWNSSLPTVAVMNLTGLATNTGTGSTNITAVGNINGKTATSNTAVLTTP